MAEVSRLARACEFADRSMRMLRVVLRRAVSVAQNGASEPMLAQAAAGMADASEVLRDALREGRDRIEAERMFTRVAHTLRPTLAMNEDIEQTTMLLLLRPLAVDLLQAAGASHDEAQAALPALEVEPETGALRYVEEQNPDPADAEAGASSEVGAESQPQVGTDDGDVRRDGTGASKAGPAAPPPAG